MIGGRMPDVSKNIICEDDKPTYAVFSVYGTEWVQWSTWIPFGRAKAFLEDTQSNTDGDFVILKRICI